MARRPRTIAAEPADAATGKIRALAREVGAEAIAALMRLSREALSEPVRLAAIKELLDRGFGRAAAAADENAGGVTAHVLVDDGYAN